MSELNHKSQKHPKKSGGKLIAAFHKFRQAVARHPVSPLLYVTLLAVAIGYIVFDDMYSRAYVVNVDGHELGIVADVGEVESMLTSVEARVSGILGEEYNYGGSVTVTPAYAPAKSFSNSSDMENVLFEEAGALMEAYGIYVDGMHFGYGATEEDLRGLLDAIAAPYMNDESTGYGFVEKVEICPVEIPANTQFDLDSVYAALTVCTVEEAFYVVKAGDTFNAIAYSLGMTPADLSALNPGININKLSVGQKLIIQQAIPFLSVINYANETYEEVVSSPIEYIDTADMYVGNTKVKEQGTDGLALVNADVVYINGVETERTVLYYETLEEPTVTHMYRGTTPRPKTASNGYYIWPTASHKITSPYGYRTLNGVYEFHLGIDIGAGRGTNINAADGGKVTYAGWKGSYGYLVIITHDNGSQTYYAHCSKLLVKYGDKVYQGQTIAKVGSTGNSTGPHLHFEIRINGKTVNPRNYLK